MSYQDTVPRIMDIDACEGVTIKENAAKPRTKRRTAAIRFIADPCSTFSLRPINLLFVHPAASSAPDKMPHNREDDYHDNCLNEHK